MPIQKLVKEKETRNMPTFPLIILTFAHLFRDKHGIRRNPEISFACLSRRLGKNPRILPRENWKQTGETITQPFVAKDRKY